jgi:hypothetical protein
MLSVISSAATRRTAAADGGGIDLGHDGLKNRLARHRKHVSDCVVQPAVQGMSENDGDCRSGLARHLKDVVFIKFRFLMRAKPEK